MSLLLRLAAGIDWLSRRFGQLAAWTVLLSALISAGNAFVRYGVDWSSNALLEIQWYLFAWMVMLGAPYVLLVNEHVRVDLFYGKLRGRQPVWVDIFGLLAFLLPVMGYLAWLSFPYFLQTLRTGEMSQSIGGLIRWPATLAMPLGFAVVWLQGLAELIKRVAYLQGLHEMDTHYEKPLQ